MAKGLFQLGQLFDNEQYSTISTTLLHTMTQRMDAYPSGHSNWAQLLLAHVFAYPEIAITGPIALEMRAQFMEHYLPNRQFMGSTLASTLPLLEGKTMDATMIYVCFDKSCKLPVETVDNALKQIQ